MSKLLVLVMSMTSLSGCVWQNTSGYEVSVANKWCADKGGVAEIRTTFLPMTLVKCKSLEGVPTRFSSISYIELQFEKNKVK